MGQRAARERSRWSESSFSARLVFCALFSLALVVLQAIRAASRGESVLAPSVASRMMERMRAPAREALTGREIEVLTEVADGKSNREIAGVLFISEATVKTHLIHIFSKLGVDDRTAAVTSALEQGVLRL